MRKPHPHNCSIVLRRVGCFVLLLGDALGTSLICCA